MYVIRRVYEMKESRDTRLGATLAQLVAQRYVDVDQRTPVTVYFNGGTLPGEKGRVYMDWTAEKIESPYRGDNVFPTDEGGYSARLREITADSWIEFYELLSPDKRVEL
ncbi:hypothetical protein HQ535_10695 [bacterium]|nr:hypothetical protein [bacterium]